MKYLRAAGIAAALVITLASSSAHAAVILVTAEAGITADGIIDWGDLGPSFTSVANGTVVNVTGIGGLTATVSVAGAGMERRDQGNGWAGNFGGGEELLWTTAAGNGPMTLDFNSAIAGAGAQIQADNFGAFTARISAYDAGSNLLGTFDVAGNSTSDNDDSALFIGILSTDLDIARIVFGAPVTGGTAEDFAINNVRVQAGPAVVAPEPATMAMFGLGLLGLARARRTRKSNPEA